jgi:ferredoxin-thioredoxin reductase catalytic chain
VALEARYPLLVSDSLPPPELPTTPPPTATPEEKRDAALRRARKFVATYVEKGTYTLYPEPDVVENVVQGLADNLVAHGRMYCPCADVEDSKAKGSDMVCPCKPHHADIARQGYCDCALFASDQFVATERLTKKKNP